MSKKKTKNPNPYAKPAPRRTSGRTIFVAVLCAALTLAGIVLIVTGSSGKSRTRPKPPT